MILGFKRKDILLIIVVLVVTLGFYLGQEYLGRTKGDQVVVMVDGEVFGSYDLNKNQTVSINNGSNILKIQDKKAKITQADCPDKLCVHQKSISKTNESIICLPNKVVVKIAASEGSKDSGDVDTVAR